MTTPDRLYRRRPVVWEDDGDGESLSSAGDVYKHLQGCPPSPRYHGHVLGVFCGAYKSIAEAKLAVEQAADRLVAELMEVVE
jgi:hypothetical protein